MSCFKDDGTGFHEQAVQLDEALSKVNVDEAISEAFQNGMAIDEIMYVTMNHTERILRRNLVQMQLKIAANKDRM